MFEDSTFESMGTIRTHSRDWMIASFTFYGSILTAMVLIPLFYPQALSRQAISFLLQAPTLIPEPKPLPPTARTNQAPSNMNNGRIQAPTAIPILIEMFDKPEPPAGNDNLAWDPTLGGPSTGDTLFHGEAKVPVVHQEVRGPAHISSGVMAGNLIFKSMPAYPPIAKASRTQGTVVLQATIARNGTIENLHVVGGPPMLQQAALDAVKTWRYRPYLLNGLPVDVETTVNVVFSLDD